MKNGSVSAPGPEVPSEHFIGGHRLGKSGWTSALASALGWAGSGRIGVYPVSLGANREPMEFWSSFYALGSYSVCESPSRRSVARTVCVRPHHAGPGTRGPGSRRRLPHTARHLPPLSLRLESPGQLRLRRAHQAPAPGSLVIVGGPHIPRDQAACEKSSRRTRTSTRPCATRARSRWPSSSGRSRSRALNRQTSRARICRQSRG